MKKIKVMAVIAVAGLLGLNARAAAITNVDVVSVRLTALVQTNVSDTVSKVLRIKITNKDILNLIETEYTNTPALTNKGNILAVNNFFSGTFEVLDKHGSVILADASSGISDDDYNLFIEEDGDSVDAFTETDTKEVDRIVTIGFFEFENGPGTIFGEVSGATSVRRTFTDTKDSESFSLGGAGNGDLFDNSAVVIGTVTGVGKNNDTFE